MELNELRTTLRPIAKVTIEPKGRRAKGPREHVVNLEIDLLGGKAKHGDKVHVMALAKAAFAPFAPLDGIIDRRRFGEVSMRPGGPVTGVEASVAWQGNPSEESVGSLRAALAAEGYRVTIREMRECSHSKCATEVLHAWNQPASIPSGWYRNTICGKHQYRTCAKCQGVYVMSSVNSVGQAPSVRCEVCSHMMIEWGGSKVWTARLVTRGDAGAEATEAGIAADGLERTPEA